MKLLFTLVSLLSINLALADGVTELKNGDVSLYGADVEIVSIKPMCQPARPGGVSCMAYGSIVTLKVHLSGCLDRFAGYSSTYDIKNGKATVYFAGVNIFNKASTYTRCAVAPFELVEVSVPHQGKIDVINLEFNGTTQPQH